MEETMEFYRKQFYLEARDLLDRVSEDILKAEADPQNSELLNSIFRGIHTIKGCAGSFEMPALSEFAHGFEGLLNELRDEKITLNSEMVDAVLQGVDWLNNMLDHCETGSAPSLNHELSEKFKSFLYMVPDVPHEKKKEKKSSVIDDKTISENFADLPEELQRSVKKLLTENMHFYSVKVNYTSEIFENGFDPAIFLRNFKEASIFYQAQTDLVNMPPLVEFLPLTLYLHPSVYAITSMTADEIKDISFEPSLIEVYEFKDCITREMLQEFLYGARDMIEVIEREIINYEQNNSMEALNSVFRSFHTIKGDSDYIGLKDLTVFTHSVESLLSLLRSEKLKKNSEIIDIILKSADLLKEAMKNLSSGEGESDFSSLLARVRSVIAKQEGQKSGNEILNAFIEQALQYESIISMCKGKAKAPLNDQERLRILRRAFLSLKKASSFMEFKDIELLIDESLDYLDKGMEELAFQNHEKILSLISSLKGEKKKIGEILVEKGKITEKDLEEALREQGKAITPGEDQTVSSRKPEQGEAKISTLKVDEEKIDDFSNMIGELLVARNTYEYILGNISDGMNGENLNLLRENLHLFSRVTHGLQKGVMSLRMIPIKGIFQKFSRVVRDISRKQNKLIDIITSGEDTEIDKKVADILSDPLIHLIRNSCDHGIETPSERAASGKNEKGTIILSASQEAGNLIIKIIDDGRGLQRKKLREKAGTMGIEIKNDDELFNLIFLPGLSTNEEVSDISGRGVGMDVVKTTVKSLGGKVKVTSEEGNGTEITLTIPMTMGISVVLLVESGNKNYALPLDYVVETIKIDSRKLRRIHDRKGCYYRGEVIPVEKLDILLERMSCDSGLKLKKYSAHKELSLAILKNGSGKFGVIVDRLKKNMELAIKPVPESLSSIDVISGVSILGDGNVVLVLNPEKLI